MKLVAISSIAVDSGTQIRAAIDQQVVADYAEAMTNGAEFPPIVLFHDGNTHHVGDGFHRLMAAQRNQFRDVPADVRAGTQQDALWFALGANKANGKRLTEADKKHAVMLAFEYWPDRGQREIADQIGCAQSYVQKLRADYQVNTGVHLPERIIGKDGKSYPATYKSAPNPKHAQIVELVRDGQSTEAIQAAVGGVSNTAIAKVRKELGVSTLDKSRAAIADRHQRMREMAADGHTSRQIASAVGLSEQGCRETMRRESIEVPADKVTGRTKRHDSNRIVERMVMDAENLTADVNLIVFADLNPLSLSAWVDSLCASQKALGSFIRKLKEQQKHGEAA